MGCRVVYAIVPETSVDYFINKRAYERARQLIEKADTHRVLESQAFLSLSCNAYSAS